MSTSLATTGDTIERLGAAADAGAITLADAVTQLRAVDPSLTVQGATAQLRSWRGAASRYQLAAAASPARLDVTRNARSFRREPIVFRFPAAENGDAA